MTLDPDQSSEWVPVTAMALGDRVVVEGVEMVCVEMGLDADCAPTSKFKRLDALTDDERAALASRGIDLEDR